MKLVLMLTFAFVTAFAMSPAEANSGAATAGETETLAECGGTVVVDCTHTHGGTSFHCATYTEGYFHVRAGTPLLEVQSDCLHYL